MFYVIVPPLLSSLDQKWVYTLCLCVPLRRLRVLIQQRWRCPWWGCLQCGSWSTLYLSRERASPAGRLWNSNYNTTALMVRNKGPITVSVSFEKALDSSVSKWYCDVVICHRCRVVARSGASLSPECVWEYAADQPGRKGCSTKCSWTAGSTGTSTPTTSHNIPLGQPTFLR